MKAIELLAGFVAVVIILFLGHFFLFGGEKQLPGWLWWLQSLPAYLQFIRMPSG